MGLSLDPYCDICLTECCAVISDTEHVFCKCSKVANVWKKLKEVTLGLLKCHNMEDLRILTLNLPLKKCPGIAGLIGLYVSKVWRIMGSTICEDELFGFLRFKFKSCQLGTKQQIDKVDEMLR